MPGLRPVINKRRCPAQQAICLAIQACPVDTALFYLADEDEPLGGRIVVDYALCNGCGACASACCGSAINMRDLSLGQEPA